jgi:hypothetical protein
MTSAQNLKWSGYVNYSDFPLASLAVPLVDLFPVCQPLGSTMRWEEPPALVQVAVRLATLRQIATFAVA